MKKTGIRYVFILSLILSSIVLPACSKKNVEAVEPDGKQGPLLIYHDGTTVETFGEEWEKMLSVPPEEGLYCWGWTDSEGSVYMPGTPAPDALFQQCCVKLGDRTEHKAYIFPNENGEYELDRYVRMRDVVGMFGTLLTASEKTEQEDIENPEALWIKGIEQMRRYGILQEDFVNPEENVTYGDLYLWLYSCFPRPEGVYVFSDIYPEDAAFEAMCLAAEKGWFPYKENMHSGREQFFTIREFILIMNNALDRNPSADCIPAEIRLLLRDRTEDETILPALAEATTDHSVEIEDEAEKWREFHTSILLEPGPRWVANDLYWVDESGMYVVDKEYNGFRFDQEGKYTSGNIELDKFVSAVLNELLQPEMTQEEKLKAVYHYSVNHFAPGGGLNYEWGTEDWWTEAALTMFKRGKGDCSSFAAVFCALARPLGYRMRVSTGQTFGAGVHSWAYLFVDGEEHIFDPQSEKRYSRNMFNMEPQKWKQYEYDPVYLEEPEMNG